MLSLQKLKQQVSDEVQNNILSYWLEMVDTKRGGFNCYASFEGDIDLNHQKSVLLHSRILWSFSAAQITFPCNDYLEVAQHTFQFMKDHALDRTNGGVYWMLDSDGKVSDPQKHIYNQSFAIYALSEFYKATQSEEALCIAIELFDLVEKHGFDSINGGYHEAFNETWQPIDNQLVCDTEEGVLAGKSMNTHLHILEAYSNLYKVWPNHLLESRIHHLLLLFKDTIIDDKLHFRLFFTPEWQCISNDVSYGHDIEGTWLLDDAANQIHDRHLASDIYTLTSKMAEVTLREGLDTDGAVFNELQAGRLLDSDRIWWVQAEAMVGFYNAFQKDFAPEFWQGTNGCWNIITSTLVDIKHGEWHWKTDRSGTPYTNEPKVEPWKCPYHNARACLEIYCRINAYEEQKNVCC
ncbi:N-acylglucosamine 2-epimerase [Vibrio sp. F13]|uniref:AGE family epimerase/isomerase n=1 Tax=Vibrio sp. F13 TaxID=2070777 RepID=UPI0010BDF020|nr:AGE family epimerase/isomerase [Vibrio sp. F13]TKF54657.1 N-acylglucosamine 2-epimerase [Vibrio sp. F13]